MRRLLALLVTLILALGLGVMGSTSAAADESVPDFNTYPEVVTIGGPTDTSDVVFSPQRTSVRVTMSAEIRETSADWVYQRTTGWYGSHEIELHPVRNKLTGNIRQLVFEADIPNAIDEMVFRGRQRTTLESLYHWKYDTTETPYGVFGERYIHAQGEAVVTLDGPARTAADHSLTLTGSVRCFWLNSYEPPLKHHDVRMEFRPDGDQTWQEMGDADYDRDLDTFRYHNSSVRASGVWRARSGSYDHCYIAYSPSLHVTAVPLVTAPSAPRSPKFTRSSRSAKLSWATPASDGGAAIDAYQVRRGPTTTKLKSSARSHTFTGLQPLRSYTFDVRAHNSEGWGPWLTASTTTTAPAPKAYPNCAALNKDYPHGVGRSGAADKSSGPKVTNFHRSTKTYKMNDGRVKSKKQYDLDRDNDGIACERR